MRQIRLRTALFSFLLLAAPQSWSQEVFHYDQQGLSRPQGRHIHLLRDAEADPADLVRLSQLPGTPFMEDVPNLGIGSAPKWLRFRLSNHTEWDKLVVRLDHAEVDSVEVHAIEGDKAVLIARTGQAVLPSDRIGGRSDLNFEMPIQPGEERVLLLRLRSSKQLQVPLLVGSISAIAELSAARNLFIGGYFGIMMVLALYNFFIFLSTRDRSYLYYVLYIALLCFAQLAIQGVVQVRFWPSNTWFGVRSSMLFTLGSMLFAGAFIREFIRTRTLIPPIDRFLRLFMIVIVASMGLVISPMTTLAYQVTQVLSGSFSLTLIVSAVWSWRRGSREAKFFLGAWSFFLAGVIVYLLKDKGVLPFNSLTLNAMPIGSVLEGVLLSFGLADRINILRREKEESQAEALAASLENERIIREQNVILEEKVTERTHALQESNEHLKRTQTQLVNAEKMASLGQLTAGIAHEINNPINFITSNIAPLRRNISEIVEVMRGYRALDPAGAAEQLEALKQRERELGIQDSIDELDDIIGSIAEGSSRTAEIVRGLRNFSRLDEDDLKDADLNEGLRNTLTVLGPQYRDRVRLELDLGALPPVECFPGKVNQVFMNVLTNAVQAAVAGKDGSGPTVRLATAREGDRVVVRISDNGIGMSEAVKARMYDPFFTTKAVGEGTGLGLAIAYGIVQDHHGTIEADSVPGAGTEFRITLPLRHPRHEQQRA